MMKSVWAITVTYGDRFESYCKSTIEHALAAGAQRVVVVDNGSPRRNADSIHEFADRHPQILVIRKEGNSGSAVGFGSGMLAAASAEPDYLWLLDDDNLAGPRALADLLDIQSAAALHFDDELVAVCAARNLNSFHARIRGGQRAESVYPPAGAFLSFDLLNYIGRISRRAAYGRPGKFEPIPYAPYGGLLLRRELLERIGVPSPEFILYADDTHWTSQIVALGHPLVLATDVEVVDADSKWLGSGSNFVSSSMSSPSRDRLYLSTRNQVWLDHGRLGHAGQRARYIFNRTIVTSTAWCAARRGGSAGNYEVFRRAIRHGEAGVFSCSPVLSDGGFSAD